MVDFWLDRWMGEDTLARVCGKGNPPHALVAEFFNEEGWNVTKLQQRLPLQIASSIAQMNIDRMEKDKLVWVPSKSREFSVFSARNLIRRKPNMFVSCNVIWNSLLPINISFFDWRHLQGYLP